MNASDASSIPWVPLWVQSERSVHEGMVRIKDYAHTLVAQGVRVMPLADVGNIYGAVEAFQTAQACGLKPLIGACLWVRETQNTPPTRLILYCQNTTGYRNLCALLTQAQHHKEAGLPVLPFEALKNDNLEGLLALSGGLHSHVAHELLAGHASLAEATLKRWAALMPQRFYVAIHRVGWSHEEAYLQAVLPLAFAAQIPVIATHPVLFLKAHEFQAHEARVCIQQGWTLGDPQRPQWHTPEQYLKTPAEMAALFRDVPGALENTVHFATRCSFRFTLGQAAFPCFPVPEGHTADSFLKAEALKGLKERLSMAGVPETAHGPYHERLAFEQDIIVRMGFSAYFLIVSDFIRWALANDIPVGPGRGSGAGSLVAYVLRITELDPLKHQLLFERFLNPERVSLPDFDIDFCVDGRDKVIHYVMQRYGAEQVSQIVTFGTMAAKAVIRDVGRVLGMPYGFVDKIAKLIPNDLGITLEQALEQEPQLPALMEEEEEVATLMDLARQLEGLTRSVGRHAGGVVIAPEPLIHYAPLYWESPDAMPAVQFDKDDAEAVGLLKFDFLGLRNLTVIHAAVKLINQRHTEEDRAPLNISVLPLDDAPTYAYLKQGHTTAIFQLESRGMKDLVVRLQPDHFEDIVALIALFRPGPLQSGMVDDFIDRKHGVKEVVYPHPSLEAILKPTYGVILYQEQVMQIAQTLSGYTLGSADLLRRAMGKKKVEEMAQQRAIFVEGAKAEGVHEHLATAIFDLIEKFAGYGFNKSHSAAYALISYQTAYLKTHHGDAFMTAVLSADMIHTDKVVLFLCEAQRMGLTLLPPDVQHSQTLFSLEGKGRIRYGLGAIKGVGVTALHAVLATRPPGGFQSLGAFLKAAAPHMNRKMCEALIDAGALDAFGIHRACLRAGVDPWLKHHQKAAQSAQPSLFGAEQDSLEEVHEGGLGQVPPMPPLLLLSREKAVLGHYWSGHPVCHYQREAELWETTPLRYLPRRDGASALLGVMITDLRVLFTKKMEKMAFLQCKDATGVLEVHVFPQVYEEHRTCLKVDAFVAMGVEVKQGRDGRVRVGLSRAEPVERARAQAKATLTLKVPARFLAQEGLARLKNTLLPHAHPSSGVDVVVVYQHAEGEAHLSLGERWRAVPTDALMLALSDLLGEEALTLNYPKGSVAWGALKQKETAST